MGMNTFTTIMTSSQTISIDKADGVMSLSVQAAPGGGTFNFLGNYTFKGVPPTALSLTNGQGVTLFAASTAATLSGITIQWVSGTVEVVISVQ